MPDYITKKIPLPIQIGSQEISNSKDQIIYADPVVLISPSGEFITSNSDGGATEGNQEAILQRLPSALVNDRLKVDVQSLNVTINNAQLEISNDQGNPIPVNGNVNATLTTIGDIATNTTLTSLLNKIPSTPSLEHTTSNSPSSVRLTDGTNFYKATTPLDTQPISGTITANVGTTNGLALDSTLTNGNQKVKLTDGTNSPIISNTTVTGNEYALVTRTIPSGTQTVNGTITFTNTVIGVTSLPPLPSGGNTIGSVNVTNFPTNQVVSGSVNVTNTSFQVSNTSSNPVPISVSALPLPTGASQDRITSTNFSAVRLTDGNNFYKPTTPSDTQTIAGIVSISNFPTTQNVNVTNSSLTIAGTVNLDSTNTGYLNSINTKIPIKGLATASGSTPVVIASDQASIPVTIQNSSLEISNDVGNPVPVNGTVAFSNTSIQVSNTIAVSGSVTANLDSTNSGYLSNLNTAIGSPITGVSLPSGSGWYGWLSYIFNLLNIRIPLLGQASNSNSIPVVLPVSQISTLTPLSTVTANLDSVNTSTLTSINSNTSTLTSINSNTSNSNTYLNSIDSKTPALVSGRVPVDVQSLNVNISNAQLEISNDVGNPIPVNGTIAFSNSSIGISSLPPIPPGTNSIGSINNTGFNVTGTLPAFTAIPTFKIDQTTPGSTNKVSIGTDGTVTIANLNSDPATGTNQSTANTKLTSIDNKTPALGQALAASSIPVVLTASQLTTLTPLSSVAITNTTFASTQSGTWNINNISGTITLPTLASTSTLQTTGNTSLASIDAKTPALGQTTSASSVPIVIANDQSSIPVTVNRLMPQGTFVPYLNSVGANVKASSGSLYAFTATNANAAIRYFQIFNKASAPATNDVPILYFPLYASNGFLLVGQDILGGFGIDPTILTTGVTWGISTTPTTYTAATSTDHSVTVRYS